MTSLHSVSNAHFRHWLDMQCGVKNHFKSLCTDRTELPDLPQCRNVQCAHGSYQGSSPHIQFRMHPALLGACQTQWTGVMVFCWRQQQTS